MRRMIALTIFFSVITACAKLSRGSPITTPLQLHSTGVVPPAMIASPVSIHTPAATSTMGEVSVEYAEIFYYDVTGLTADELRASMDKFRPKDPYDADKPVDSYTDWDISWNWPGYGTDHCDLSGAIVTYRIKVIMPRWKAPANAPPELTAQWEKYMQSLAIHEQGHVDHIVNNYLGITTIIQSATCSTAEAEAQKALESLREFDASYDRTTRHGETQGAVFP